MPATSGAGVRAEAIRQKTDVGLECRREDALLRYGYWISRVTDLQRSASRILDAEVAGSGVRDLRHVSWVWALGDEISAQATLERLMREGLDRHDAIHAVGSVLVDFVQALIRDDAAPGANERYNDQLKKLTAAEWLKGFR